MTPTTALLLDAAVKSTLLLLWGLGVTALLRNRVSAALRHSILLCTLLATLAVPFIGPLLPTGNAVTYKPAAPPQETPVMPPLSAPPPRPAVAPGKADAPTSRPAPPTPAAPPAPFPWRGVLIGLYAVGLALVAGRVVVGLATVAQLTRQSATPPPGSAVAETFADAQTALLGARRRGEVRVSPAPVMPLMWGWPRPIVLLPAPAETWPAERLRVVLLHETGHIARRDWPAQILTQAVCAVYWFHPLVWLAAARLRAIGEQACDDRVLLAGVTPREYATHLLDIARPSATPATPIIPASGVRP